MSTFFQIPLFNLSVLNNAEYLNFYRRFIGSIPKEEEGEDRPVIESLQIGDDPSPVNISAERIAAMEELLDKLADLNKKSQAKETTAEKADTDRKRDYVITYILNRIFKSNTLPLDSEQQAGQTLYNTANPYKGIGRLPMNQETEVIKGLLIDLAKPEFAEAVNTLGLQPYLDELRRLNEQFENLVAQESATRSLSSLNEDSKELRIQLDELYADAILLANATHVLAPTEVTQTFIRDVNSLIDEVRISRNLRKTGKKESAAGDDDRPLIP